MILKGRFLTESVRKNKVIIGAQSKEMTQKLLEMPFLALLFDVQTSSVVSHLGGQ
jgi:hypothetical protein